MLRLMLDAHPDLACPGEHDFLFDYLSRDSAGGWTYDRQALEQNRIFRSSGLAFPTDLDGKAALRAMIQQVADRGNGRPVLMLHRGLPKWIHLLGRAPIIHLVRDPRDVAPSCVTMGWAGNVWYGIQPWIETETAWSVAVDVLRGRSLLLRYEDLVANPATELTRVCHYIDIEYDEAMLSYAKQTTYDLPDARFAYRWQDRADPKDVRLVEARVGNLAVELGYPLTNTNFLHPPLLERVWLFVQNKASNLQFRVRRYGLRRALGLHAARLLRIRNLERTLRLQMSEIDRRHLK